MSQPCTEPQSRLPARLAMIQQELQEMAAKAKCQGRPSEEQRERNSGPVLVIRGK